MVKKKQRRKKKNQKGFSLVELLAVVAIMGILTGISIMAYQRYVELTRKKAYNVLVSSTQSAMDEYLMDHPGATSVTLEELYEGQYIERPTDPRDKTEICRGKVTVRPAEDLEEGALDSNEYKVSLCCEGYLYTFKDNGEQVSKDQYCKVDPYDYTQINSIKVLNVYATESYKNKVKEWMNEVGKGIIQVTPVYINDFNNNPESYLGTSGNWNYDEVLFGFSDCNNNKDLSPKAATLMDTYLSQGQPAIFGHDTITAGCSTNNVGSSYTGHKNFISLAKYLNMEATKDLAWNGKTVLTIQRKGVFTEYPYAIGDIGTKLSISQSHVYGQVAHGDVWITFDGIDNPAKGIYLSTYGNNAFIQTGHTNGSATSDEKKIIANIIFYMVAKQYIEDEAW